MKNPVVLLFSLILMSGCSSLAFVDVAPPKSLNNACNILNEKPSWVGSLGDVHSKYGVPDYVILAMMYQESKFVHDARPIATGKSGLFGSPYASSAYGYSQALDMTWGHYLKSAQVYGASRENFADSAMFMGWYVDWSSRELGLKKTDVRSQYLAYHEGLGGFKAKSFEKKPWLKQVASKVSIRASHYRAQLKKCDKGQLNGDNFFSRYFL